MVSGLVHPGSDTSQWRSSCFGPDKFFSANIYFHGKCLYLRTRLCLCYSTDMKAPSFCVRLCVLMERHTCTLACDKTLGGARVLESNHFVLWFMVTSKVWWQYPAVSVNNLQCVPQVLLHYHTLQGWTSTEGFILHLQSKDVLSLWVLLCQWYGSLPYSILGKA